MELSQRERSALGASPAVTKEEFLCELWVLNPMGDPSEAYINTAYAVARKQRFDGTPLTFAFLVKAYGDYMARCQDKRTESKFIMGITNFMIKDKFNLSYENPEQDRLLDRYQ